MRNLIERLDTRVKIVPPAELNAAHPRGEARSYDLIIDEKLRIGLEELDKEEVPSEYRHLVPFRTAYEFVGERAGLEPDQTLALMKRVRNLRILEPVSLVEEKRVVLFLDWELVRAAYALAFVHTRQLVDNPTPFSPAGKTNESLTSLVRQTRALLGADPLADLINDPLTSVEKRQEIKNNKLQRQGTIFDNTSS